MRIAIAPERALILTTGDITREAADAIVNAANSSLMGGGGVDGAIHRVGGPAIKEECIRYRESHPPLPAGKAVATTAGNLPARYVIHTVGPVWWGGNRSEPAVLASCYRESLRVGDELRVVSIVFPSISTGAFGYPVDLAASVAIREIAESLPQTRHIREVRFVLFDERTFEAYKSAAEEIIPGREHS